MTRDQALIVALQALGYIAAEETLLRRFLRQSGLEPEALARQAAEPEFLAGVLDFLLGDESSLLAFCQEKGLGPAEPGAARRLLPGADREFA